MSLFLFLFFSMLLLICSFFRFERIISSEKWFNYIVTFLENVKNLGWSDDTKGRKKRGWPNR